MRLSVRALTLACGLIWGGSILFVGLVNVWAPNYGTPFLQIVSSVYPGFHASHSIGDTLVGTGYGLVDGALGGLVFAWLYNLLAGSSPGSQA